MYTIKTIQKASVLHSNNETAVCPFAMVTMPMESALGQMQIIPVNRECSSRCAAFEILEKTKVKLHCTSRVIDIQIENNFLTTL